MAIKRKPHHDLEAVKAKFACAETLEITRKAVEGARALGYSLEDIVAAVQDLEPAISSSRKPRTVRPIRRCGTIPTTCRGTADGSI